MDCEFQRSKSNLSSFFDNLTNTFNRGLYHLAVKLERPAARDLPNGMRSGTETKPDGAFHEILETPNQLNPVEKLAKEFKDFSVADSSASTTIPIGQSPLVHAVSYDTAFNLCGGDELYDELEMLCNEYAKKLNKLRSRLSGMHVLWAFLGY